MSAKQDDINRWDSVHTYTRAQAIADGFQVDVSDLAKEAGFKHPVFITRGVYDSCVAVPPGVVAQDETGRLWDIVWMTRCAILSGDQTKDRVTVQLYVRNDNKKATLTKLVSVCGPKDIDDPAPAITIMLPDED
jgi:hypothetical protein